ncbi:uncharacterized protein [Linepithema humile]|uniref:uncharacterized protein isoform X2 n=1 Tax=Linepithema humile TaxID=83485 RepID=UPI00351DBDA0
MSGGNKEKPGFAVVSFIDDDSDCSDEITSEVPECWLTSDRKKCWLLKAKDVCRLIAKSTKPSTKDKKWTLYDINIEGLYDTLDKARRRADDISSTDECIEENLKVPCTKKSVFYTNNNDTTSDEEPLKLLEPPKLKEKVNLSFPQSLVDNNIMQLDLPITNESDILSLKDAQVLATGSLTQGVELNVNNYTKPKIVADVNLTNSTVVHHPFTEDFKLIHLQNSGKQKSVTEPAWNSPQSAGKRNVINPFNKEGFAEPNLSSEEPFRCILDMMMEIVKNMATKDLVSTLMAEVTKQSLELAALKKLFLDNTLAQKVVHTETNENVKNLPLGSLAVLQTFYQELQNDKAFTANFTNYLLGVGGKNAKDCILRMLQKVFSSAVAKDCSWLGQKNNFKLQGLYIIEILRDTGRAHYQYTETAFEEIVSEWFRQGKQRDSRINKKAVWAPVDKNKNTE